MLSLIIRARDWKKVDAEPLDFSGLYTHFKSLDKRIEERAELVEGIDIDFKTGNQELNHMKRRRGLNPSETLCIIGNNQLTYGEEILKSEHKFFTKDSFERHDFDFKIKRFLVSSIPLKWVPAPCEDGGYYKTYSCHVNEGISLSYLLKT
ncbi:MAG: hypothetical protein GOU97_01535 [Nanoarchaeota archaeon]|nr:hypothetical protein [Nanoarchaeota archaeon]